MGDFKHGSLVRALTTAATFVLGFSAAATTAHAENVQWTLAAHAGGIWMEVGAKNFAQRVEFLTEGRVKIDVAAPGMVGPALKVTETVQNGLAEVGLNWMAYDIGIDKAGVVFAGWSGGLTPEEYMFWLYKGGGEELLAEWRMEKFGVVSIPCNIVETEIFLHSHKPVRTLEDFQGLRMRTSGAWAEIATELGATTVVLPGPEVFDALERKVVDAVEWGGPGINLTAGFHTIAPYIIVPGIHQPASFNECMFNKDAWETLSDHDKEAIKLAGKLNTYESFLAYGDNDIDAWRKLHETKGVEFVELDPSFIAKAKEASFAWAEKQAATNEWFKKAYDSQRETQKHMAVWGEFRLPIGQTRD
ncbi:TRAP transporter substrate-binding protein DctP [Aquibium sp. LZ166]|uniref:TRAP transporter substrate-binding protein DctP n=1 Tax=Aquibium pacificus TaxID=3153579 RepID=A0ABV3SSA7_9HYPH